MNNYREEIKKLQQDMENNPDQIKVNAARSWLAMELLALEEQGQDKADEKPTTPVTSAGIIAANMNARDEMALNLIQAHISACVSLEIEDLRRRGGHLDWQFEMVAEMCPAITSKGDAFLFGGKPGEAAEYANQLVQVLTIMAFAPGGVKAFGLHFEALTPEETEREEERGRAIWEAAQ